MPAIANDRVADTSCTARPCSFDAVTARADRPRIPTASETATVLYRANHRLDFTAGAVPSMRVTRSRCSEPASNYPSSGL